MSFLFPKAPTPPSLPNPPPAAHPATLGSAQEALAASSSKAAGAAAEGMGFNDTLKTSPMGTDTPKTAKTLLG